MKRLLMCLLILVGFVLAGCEEEEHEHHQAYRYPPPRYGYGYPEHRGYPEYRGYPEHRTSDTTIQPEGAPLAETPIQQ